MKIFKHKNIMGMIYGIVLAIPLLSILVRSAYVVVNKNAKDSYSDKTFTIQEKVTTQDFTQLVDNTTAYLNLVASDNYNSLTTASRKVRFQNLTINNTLYQSGIFTLGANIGYRDGYWISIYDDSFNFITRYSINDYVGTYQFFYVNNFSDNNFYYPNNMYDNSFTFFVILEQQQTLDNAFDYSLSKYVDENSFGKLNFFEWFFDIFFDSNQQNNLYIRYVNWYMNYVLLVSCSYILFLVLMWFVNYSRRILERGLDYDW